MANDDSSVRVAVRIRPQVASEVIDMCRVCTRVTPGEPQVTLGQDKSFTFDQVFDTGSTQLQVFDTCVETLVGGALDGYNATVLAYGQTGSGKTYTMGTGFEVECSEETSGIIPRAIRLLFRGIEARVEAARAHSPPLIPPEFKVLAQFMELYNEEIIDLFDPARDHYGSKSVGGLRITEDGDGGVRVAGATCKPVRDAADALACLRLGALARTTAATNMNAASSRSHAVFTLHLRQQRLVRAEDPDADVGPAGEPATEFETLTAKFHFVDLAGSERLKRTGATGERAREGISINCGLLALGNVISALGDKSKKVTHVPYRDSKLTRLLQDSLGGNSQTVMIACVSPSDRDFMETLNTLKYANRARNIKNKIVVNQDKSSRTISLLRQELAQLQLELLEFKQGKRILTESGEDGINDLYHENRVLQGELENLRSRVKALQGTVEQLSMKNTELLAERALAPWAAGGGGGGDASPECGLTALIQGYVKEIESLRAQLLEANNMYGILKKNATQRQQQHGAGRGNVLGPDASLLDASAAVLNDAKKELYREKELLARSMGELEFQRKMSQSTSSATGEGGGGAGEQDDTMGERERAEGESADDTDHSDDSGASDSESEDSETKACAELGAELATLSGDIDMKQRLVEELELSQRRLHSLQRHYEDKLLALHHQIKLTQEERDKVMQSYNSQVSPPSEKMKRVKEEYERKLTDMARELRRLQSAQREHSKLLRSHTSTQQQIQAVRRELQDMKRNKVKLLNKMKEESSRHKAAEARRVREVAQLRKESRKNANLIRNLEAERRLKEQVLRRKQEEVSLLRRGHRDKLSSLASGRKRERVVRKSAAHKWAALEKALVRATLSRQVVGELESDMERQIAERERLCRERELLRRRIASAAADVSGELDTLQANIAYLHETIAEAQQQIMQIEEAKESGGGEEAELSALVGEVAEAAESRFVLDKLVELVLQHSYTSARQHRLLQDTQAKLHQMELETERTEDALRLAVAAGAAGGGGGDYNLNYSSAPGSPLGAPPPAAHAPAALAHHISSGTSTRSVSPVDSTLIELRNDAKKLSRLANGSTGDASPGDRPSPFQRASNVRGSVRLREIGVYGSERGAPDDAMTQSMMAEPTHRGQPLARVPSAPGSLKGLTPVAPRRTYSHSPAQYSPAPYSPAPYSPAPYSSAQYSPAHTPLYSPGDAPASPRLQRRSQTLVAKPASMDVAAAAAAAGAGGGEWETPGSPATARRVRDDDVFCRLTTTTASADHPLGGVVKEYPGKWRGSPLQCTHVAEGHAGAVLALAAHQRTLYSGGVDRTVRVWDLEAGREVTCVAGHAHAVVCVRVEPRAGLLLSVAGAAVRVSDLRQEPLRPVRTLWSSGATGGAGGGAAGGARGEVAITDAALNPSATTLYTAVNDKLRVWDLRKMECSGKISTGHQAAVMCLAVGAAASGGDLVVTGSKDHYVRSLEARGGAASGARALLEPPHYDGVQSLALSAGGALYTGSRDMSVKRWSLDTNELLHSVNGAHKGWVMGVVTRPDGAVASCGRGGRLRVWDAALRPLASAHADDAVHALALHQHMLYTAGNGGEVRMWRWSAEQ